MEFLCYTFHVEDKHTLWRIWSSSLQRWGIQEFAASLLEASGPFNLILAQLVYVGEPFLPSGGDRSNLKALGAMLEDGKETQAFVSYLRKGMAS